MPREKLSEASERLESAAEDAASEAADRLNDLADQLDTLSERDDEPDHGRLARIQNALDDLKDGASETVREKIDAAKERIRSFREGVEGV